MSCSNVLRSVIAFSFFSQFWFSAPKYFSHSIMREEKKTRGFDGLVDVKFLDLIPRRSVFDKFKRWESVLDQWGNLLQFNEQNSKSTYREIVTSIDLFNFISSLRFYLTKSIWCPYQSAESQNLHSTFSTKYAFILKRHKYREWFIIFRT